MKIPIENIIENIVLWLSKIHVVAFIDDDGGDDDDGTTVSQRV